MSLINGCTEVSSEEEFYDKALDYWKSIPSTLNGMLGGYEHISSIDVRGSQSFLKYFVQGKQKMALNRALDCGAGIGRVSKQLLLPMFKTVDLVEVNQAFLDQAKTYLGAEAKRVGKYICCGLQDLKLEEKTYDLIWVQWVTGHLTDEHFVKFLQQCKHGLCNGGIVVIKDNVAVEGVELDSVDSSVTRNIQQLQKIFDASGLRTLRQQKQTHLPKELYRVTMTALGS
uniref:Alpha N-terminal protein methyltransferase 1 n=1 Tax=Phallusia mammillata TaxID=59560 RepID=A0A6F9DMW5_9ASCI|nr:N-terminal Xaa-Pro-Lys N-methyltransferase 1-like [Phallusia mammillata]